MKELKNLTFVEVMGSVENLDLSLGEAARYVHEACGGKDSNQLTEAQVGDYAKMFTIAAIELGALEENRRRYISLSSILEFCREREDDLRGFIKEAGKN